LVVVDQTRGTCEVIELGSEVFVIKVRSTVDDDDWWAVTQDLDLKSSHPVNSIHT
jgi:hypothetical protein